MCGELFVGFGDEEVIDIFDMSYFNGEERMKIWMIMVLGEDRRKGNGDSYFFWGYFFLEKNLV